MRRRASQSSPKLTVRTFSGTSDHSSDRNSGDVYAEVGGDSVQPGGITLPDRAELPLHAVPVQLAEDHGSLGGRVLAEVVTGELDVLRGVDEADEGVAHLAERLSPLVRVVD